MEFLQVWLPLILAAVAVLVAFVGNLRDKPNATVDLTGILDDAEGYISGTTEIISDGAEVVQEMTPAAITIVKGLRQLYLTGELEIDELKPLAVAQMTALFPHADKERLEIVIEGAVFGVKMVAKELWQRAAPVQEGDGAS